MKHQNETVAFERFVKLHQFLRDREEIMISGIKLITVDASLPVRCILSRNIRGAIRVEIAKSDKKVPELLRCRVTEIANKVRGDMKISTRPLFAKDDCFYDPLFLQVSGKFVST